jgi:predicted TIM-barrel fold metal-dependent hydrolase
MIIDTHTHIGEHPSHIDDQFAAEARQAWSEIDLAVTPDRHIAEALSDVDYAIVLAINAPAAGFVVTNDYVAEHVAREPSRLVGFGSVDPHDRNSVEELERMKYDLGLQGCKMGPIYQNVDPLGREFLRVCEALQRLEMPMLIHQGTTFSLAGPLKYAQPLLLDEIALRYPDLKMVIAHAGHPWFEDAVAVMRRHRNVFADLSALVARPWHLYQILLSAVEYRVHEKLLFGTDYPFGSARATIDGLRALTGNAFGPQMPTIDEDVVENIIHRQSFDLLGIDAPS